MRKASFTCEKCGTKHQFDVDEDDEKEGLVVTIFCGCGMVYPNIILVHKEGEDKDE